MGRAPEVVYEVESVENAVYTPYFTAFGGAVKKKRCVRKSDGKTVSPVAGGAVD